jgi:hypothetical protein
MDSSKRQEVKIEFCGLGPIPPRTAVFVESEGAMKNGQVIDLTWVRKTYTCADCSFRTQVVAEMDDHQAHQSRYHTLSQRWRRFWAIFFTNLTRQSPLSGKASVTEIPGGSN